MLVSGGTLQFINMTTYQVINEISEVHAEGCLYQVDKDRVFAGKYHEFWIVNINKFEVENHVYDSYFGAVTSAMTLRDNKTLFISAISDWFMLYDIENKKVTKTKRVHVKKVIAIDGETFMTSSNNTDYDIEESEHDTAVRVWKY